ncbi:hypothetical protein CEXT_224361 [Caerostris extrusa]|uniref:Uncharacterized protein n=1 Tax=Caerostris extrusa TaxID=172846 RepID=A0AAV4ST84_CAEEX|nr:hypothetical protein CEXT_224361 [Caerostris extrusa]
MHSLQGMSRHLILKLIYTESGMVKSAVLHLMTYMITIEQLDTSKLIKMHRSNWPGKEYYYMVKRSLMDLIRHSKKSIIKELERSKGDADIAIIK